MKSGRYTGDGLLKCFAFTDFMGNTYIQLPKRGLNLENFATQLHCDSAPI